MIIAAIAQIGLNEVADPMTERDEMVALAEAALEYIGAIPKDLALPAMPGFDRDWANDVLHRSRSVARAETAESRVKGLEQERNVQMLRALKAERERDEAREALKPFAAQAECWPEIPDNQAMMTSNGEDLSSLDFLMSDLRAARAITGEKS